MHNKCIEQSIIKEKKKKHKLYNSYQTILYNNVEFPNFKDLKKIRYFQYIRLYYTFKIRNYVLTNLLVVNNVNQEV